MEDTTNRYVDTEPKVQPAPVEKVQPKPAPIEKVQPAPVEKALPSPVEKVQPAPAEKVQPKPAPVEKVQPVPVEKASPAVEPTKTDAVEKRLEALKRLYEKNLISKEDYEKKKTEILKDL